MRVSSTIATAALAGLASARHCQNLTVEVNISARNGKFNQPIPVTNIDVTNFNLDLTQQGKNYSAAVLEGYQTIARKWKIAATYCQPDHGPSNVVQVLTHGIGFDRSYWDLSYNNYNYSYVCEAVDQYGYSTFSYDRPGIGQSQHGDPLNEIQALFEVDALRAITQGLRNGQINGIHHKFNKVVHVGHSFGSQHTYALTAMYPGISDGIALTGFSQNGSFSAEFVLGGNFIQANKVAALSQYPNGYFAAGDPTGVQINFFSPGGFDPAILTLAYTTGEPVTVGELLSFGGETGSINNFAGPTLIITGERDIPYCGGNCLAAPTGFTSIPAQSLPKIPNAKNPKVFIVPGAGHGLNLEYSHPLTYGTINDYFVQNGLAA
jgi:pimeloyl-ACP methyl ester carboxylesterase